MIGDVNALLKEACGTDGHGAGVGPRMSRPIRGDSSAPSHASCVEGASINLTPISRWRRSCGISPAGWRPMAITTRCRTRPKKGLRRTHQKARVQNAENIPPQHGMRNDCRSLHVLTTASNECKRCKVKCVRLDDSADCQRCSTMKVICIVVPTAIQTAKEKDRNKEKSHMEE